MFWKSKPFDPAPYVECILQQRCFRCGGEYEEWDRRLHKGLFSHLPECGKIRGQFVRYCNQCRLGEIYFLTTEGISDFTWQITLDYLPPIEFLGAELDSEILVDQLKPSDDKVTKFTLESRIFLDHLQDGDKILSFSSPNKDWQNLAGRFGYAIVRGGEPVVAIVTTLS